MGYLEGSRIGGPSFSRGAGKDSIELGCGTAYISAWLSRRGARVVGIDNSEAQHTQRRPESATTRGIVIPRFEANIFWRNQEYRPYTQE